MARHTREHRRVAVVGAGFSGLGVAVRLRREGITDFVLLERAKALGGTWRDNTYPGSACDVPSHLYHFSFAPNPDWPRTFSGAQAIWDYMEKLADDFDVRRHIRLDHAVRGLRWDNDELRWEIDTTRGEFTADVAIIAVGPLSEPRIPDIPGLDGFSGRVFHSAQWDHAYDLRGKRVAMVGTGASAIQIVPSIQPSVERLAVFQRTPPWVIPRADRPITAVERWLHRRVPATAKLRRGVLWGIRELEVGAFTKRPDVLRFVQGLASRHMKSVVKDPEMRRILTPDYRIGCKRILLSNDYYPALIRPNVHVIPEGLREISGSELIGTDGTRFEADAIVFGTGFRVTDLPVADRVKGLDGTTLEEACPDGLAALRGTCVSGFPNLLTMIGPNTGLGNSSMLLMIEAQLNYLADYLEQLDSFGGRAALDVRRDAMDAWNTMVQERLKRTVWNTGGCVSWYLDANGRNTTLWPGTTSEFRRETRRVRIAEFEVLR